MGAAYLGSVRSFRVTPCSLHPRGQGAEFGVAGQGVGCWRVPGGRRTRPIWSFLPVGVFTEANGGDALRHRMVV